MPVFVSVYGTKDHPHAYGDKLPYILVRCRTYRIIPTRMGTRVKFEHLYSLRTDHPHAYGDKGNSSKILSHEAGSSPRVWGQGHAIRLHHKHILIIPTRMGTRGCGSGAKGSFKDHPHAYGDKFTSTVKLTLHTGSSPRVWGQEENQYLLGNGAGIIPTRMGTSLRINVSTAECQDHPHAYGDKQLGQ